LTIHRQLLSIKQEEKSHNRESLPFWLVKKVRKIYNDKDAFDDSVPAYVKSKIEVDHREPTIRNPAPGYPSKNASNKEFENRYMLLTRQNNLRKSRACEHCKRTGKRAASRDGVKHWYEGVEKYDSKIGCIGCFWAYPEKWRESVNDKKR